MKIVVKDQVDLYLVPLEQEHAHELFNLIQENRKYLDQWLAWPSITKKVDDSLDYIKFCEKNFQNKKSINMGLFQAGSLIGAIGQNKVDIQNAHYELGYWLSEKYSGRGITTSASKSFINYFFEEQNFKTVYIAIATKNIASRKVAEKMGAKLDGVIRNREKLLNGQFVDHAYYSITKEDLLRSL